MLLLFLAPCLVPRSGGFLVIGSSVNHQGKGCAEKGQCDLGPYFLQQGRGCCSESWLPDRCWHSGGLGIRWQTEEGLEPSGPWKPGCPCELQGKDCKLPCLSMPEGGKALWSLDKGAATTGPAFSCQGEWNEGHYSWIVSFSKGS